MKRIYLIDCPGIVPPNANDDETTILLRGVVRVENVENPEQYISAVLDKTKQHHLERTYDVRGWTTAHEFLELLARKGGRLLRGGEADLDGVAKMVLNDFMRGKIPWFTAPPLGGEAGDAAVVVEGREGRLGEMPRKRKRVDDGDDDDDEEVVEVSDVELDGPGGEDGFDGFSGEEREGEDDQTGADVDDEAGNEEGVGGVTVPEEVQVP